jgi:hypothetical protein
MRSYTQWRVTTVEMLAVNCSKNAYLLNGEEAKGGISHDQTKPASGHANN